VNCYCRRGRRGRQAYVIAAGHQTRASHQCAAPSKSASACQIGKTQLAKRHARAGRKSGGRFKAHAPRSASGRFRPVNLVLAVRFPALGQLTGEARSVRGYRSPEVPWNIPSRKCGIPRLAWLPRRCKRRTVNPQVPGSSPGRGAKLHAACSDAGRFLLLRNSCFAPQNVDKFV
jgi:hypothetical protein